MAWNDYGLGEDEITYQINSFVWGFAQGLPWNSDREMVAFIMAAENIIRWTNQSEKYASEFCKETWFDRGEFNQLMSRAFYEWDGHIKRINKK